MLNIFTTFLQDLDTDACYPEWFSDNGGSSDRWIGKQSEHGRGLRQLVRHIQILDLQSELLEQELSQKSNSRLSRLHEIKEKVDVVQACKILFLFNCFTSFISSTCVIPNWLCYCRSISVEAIPFMEAVVIMDQQVLTTLLPCKVLCKPCSPPVCSWLMKSEASISQKCKKKTLM